MENVVGLDELVPDSIRVIRNPVDGTYNLYALMITKPVEGGTGVSTLISLKSERLHLRRNFCFNMTLSNEIEYIEV